ncbi:1-aminocyclopropane-1-carboxylate synthase 4-like [Solanum stenotomum]|uniref:1-aminocyclopropane-1-carboxylate synthase 4-like n=1 Tax=Solanum stenotomum TaxID=172797 RepID=UPI0020D0794A|nr:1-aminocyclopropane-1-carboxylate synthase 4-like [Solanum stenotomum]
MSSLSKFMGANVVLSKLATNKQYAENLPYVEGMKAYDNNPFHPVKNPNGVILMNLADNQLSVDRIKEYWTKKNPQISVEFFAKFANFQDYHGLPEFTEAIAKYMEETRGGKVKFDPKRVVMSAEANGAKQTLISCLADPGDALLVPAPFYPGFAKDIRWGTKVQLVPISCKSSNNFKITIEAIKETFEKVQEEKIKVKGMILSNPSNPLGTILDRDTLKKILTFTNEHNIHLVCDEIYAGTVFDAPQFVSIAEIMDEISCVNKKLVHIVSSVSKEVGFPGFQVEIVYSFNDDVVNCARKMSSFSLVSSLTQHSLPSMFGNGFIEKFLIENTKKLRERHEKFTSELEKVGIKCLKSNAGVYCWVDLTTFLKEKTPDAEESLRKLIINEAKLNISPGSSFSCSEAGWFRICFANIDDQTMEIALQRIQKFVQSKT